VSHHEAWFERFEDDESQMSWVVLDSRHRVVGSVSIYDIDTQAGTAKFGRLMASQTLARPHRLGKSLSRFAIHSAECIGLHRLTLDVFETNQRAIALYRSLGFSQTGIRDRQLHMTLKLEHHAITFTN